MTSSADSRITIFSRGIVIVDTAPGRHETQAVCMILPPCMAAALRVTMSWPALDSGALGTMKPKVFGSHTPAKRGAGATDFAATAAVRDRAGFVRDAVACADGNLFRRLTTRHAIGADVICHACRGVAMEGEHGFPGLRVVLRIIDGDAVLEATVWQHAQTLGQRQLLRVRQARCIHHRRVDQSDGAYHERACFPVPHRKSHRQRQRRIHGTGAEIDNAEPSIPAVDECERLPSARISSG